MISLALVVILPLLFLILITTSSTRKIKVLFPVLLVHSLLSITALSAVASHRIDLELSDNVALILRIVSWGIFFIAMLVQARREPRLTAMLCWSVVAVLLITFSTIAYSIVNGVALPEQGLLRVGFLAFVIICLFVCYPRIVDKGMQGELCRVFTALAVYWMGISVYAISVFGFTHVWAVKLGRPLGSGMMSFLLASGLICSQVVNNSWISLILLLGVVSCGSRLDTIVSLLYVLFSYRTFGRTLSTRPVVRIVALALLALVGFFLINAEEAKRTSYFYYRDEITSGRFDLLARFTERIADSPWFGAGQRIFYETKQQDLDGDNVAVRAHNAFLEAAASYGILAALACTIVSWLPLIYVRSFQIPTLLRSVSFWLSALYVSHTLVDTSSWTNLGDGTVALVFLVLIPIPEWYHRRRCGHSSERFLWRTMGSSASYRNISRQCPITPTSGAKVQS